MRRWRPTPRGCAGAMRSPRRAPRPGGRPRWSASLLPPEFVEESGADLGRAGAFARRAGDDLTETDLEPLVLAAGVADGEVRLEGGGVLGGRLPAEPGLQLIEGAVAVEWGVHA